VFDRTARFAVVCILVVPAVPVLADPICSAPPVNTNPSRRQVALSNLSAGEISRHEAMQAMDERGYWVVKTYPIDFGLNPGLQLDGHVRASQVGAEGNPDDTGKYLTLVNDNKVPVYFNWTPSMPDGKLMPGESRKIGLGIYQPTNKLAQPVSVPLTIMYWVSTGTVPVASGAVPTAPKRCSTNREFFMNAAKSQAVYEIAKRYISWQTYQLDFPEVAPPALKDGPATYTRDAGPIRFTYSATAAKTTLTIVNTAQTVALIQCTGYDHISVYQPGAPFTTSQNSVPDHYGWKAVSTSCQVALAPSDGLLADASAENRDAQK
jgi:hypothetical protein